MEEKVLDLEDVLERVQDDHELLLELFDIFENDYLDKREQLNHLVKENKLEEIRDVAHSMKGAAGNISVKALFSSCANIEQSAEKKDLHSIKPILPVLDKQFADLQAYIVDYKKNFKKHG